MELTYEEQLLLDNSKEHLKVVLSNIRIASEELSGILTKVEDARTTLAEAIESRDNIIALSLGVTSKQNERTAQLDRREESLITRENEQKKTDEEYQNKITQAKKELEDVNRETVQATVQGNRLVGLYSDTLADLQGKINDSNTKLGKNEEEYKEKLIVKQNIENEITRLTSEAEEGEKRLAKFLKETAEVMAETNRLIEEERAKIKNPLELLKRETEKLEVFKIDLLVLKSRMVEQYNKLNPEKILPIELQNNGEK